MRSRASISFAQSSKQPFTNYSRWRLLVNDGGRHTWHYLRSDEECEAWPQNDVDKYWTAQPLNLPALPKANTPLEAAQNGYTCYKHLQSHDGHWAGEYGGPMFLLPGLVIGSYVAGLGFKEEERLEMIRYLINRAHPEDGGWGIHIEGHSTSLGMSADHPVAVKARVMLHKLGGATGAPAWGKFWLAVLNVYDWEGVNPIPPELWLLPDWVPFHPHKWWIHTRNMEENDLIRSLREELYPTDYHRIYWPAQRNNIAAVDVYASHTAVLDAMNVVLSTYEACAIPAVRKAALKRAYQLVVYEDENTDYQTIGPVSKMINLLCRFHAEGTDTEVYRQHAIKRADFMWLGPEGMMISGIFGFITQAMVETGLAKEEGNKESLKAALGWLDVCQIRENPKHYESAYRHRTKGAWPFSTKEQGYTVSDCTGEGLKSVLYLQNQVEGTEKVISDERLFDAVDTLLSMQNDNGGYASYELVRGPKWLEWLNPAEVFGDIMIEFCYPECTTSVITSLSIFKKHYPNYRSGEINRTIRKSIKWLHEVQRPEGGWLGSWGICFTYATQFALESLSLAGENYTNSPAVRRACEFLLGKQRQDGGWGESYKSCELCAWTEHENTQVVQTCWAAMALMYAKYPSAEPIERAVRLVMSRQLPDGSWPQEAIEGVFNKNCAISYPNFKFSFPIWMLGKAHYYLKELKASTTN
ncbi:terpenoid cyclases/protein prenyltransferase alpha-alpha toroid [Melanogaster broomeanus]|nr:terpenoid cyclases/protein prenyltransferase alpha-alpha toroid [Melanogaster broomeanus]